MKNLSKKRRIKGLKLITKMELQPGMVLGEDVVNQGQVVFAADTRVDDRMIEKLNRYPSVLCVTVKESIDLATTHFEKIRCNEQFQAFERAHGEALLKYRDTMLEFMITGVKIPDEFFLDLYNELYSLIPSNTMLLDFLYNMTPNEDELTFTQCLNSALLGGIFADWLDMNAEAKKTMILCGFYYDIGKLTIPYNLLWKPGQLTESEYEQIKKHPIIGYETVRSLNLNDHVKNGILMHHERMDGSGYPYQFSGSNIDVYARYLAIIDSYTAMASPRAYRTAFTPLQILGVFEKNMEKFDVELLLPLMRRIADAQMGTKVMLNDDTIWEVLIIHHHKMSRPILKNDKNEILDLIDHPELQIIKNI